MILQAFTIISVNHCTPMTSHKLHQKKSPALEPQLDMVYDPYNHCTIPVPILVGGIPTPLKNMKVSWDDDIPN